MNIINEKKGFTLVELLAVIVVLAIVILIASSSVGTAMTKARKSALAIEGSELINAAKNAYQFGIIDNSVGSGAACYSLEYLFKEGYFSKGSDKDNYVGSVLVKPNGNSVEYKFWISNGSFVFANAEGGVSGEAAQVSPDAASKDCGGATGLKFFDWDKANNKVITTSK